jgi:hypothetical protein
VVGGEAGGGGGGGGGGGRRGGGGGWGWREEGGGGGWGWREEGGGGGGGGGRRRGGAGGCHLVLWGWHIHSVCNAAENESIDPIFVSFPLPPSEESDGTWRQPTSKINYSTITDIQSTVSTSEWDLRFYGQSAHPKLACKRQLGMPQECHFFTSHNLQLEVLRYRTQHAASLLVNDLFTQRLLDSRWFVDGGTLKS